LVADDVGCGSDGRAVHPMLRSIDADLIRTNSADRLDLRPYRC
jgi:hypothetical protein